MGGERDGRLCQAAPPDSNVQANLWRAAVSAPDPAVHPAGATIAGSERHADHADRARLRLYKSDALRCGISPSGRVEPPGLPPEHLALTLAVVRSADGNLAILRGNH